jgi:hypothetical protein
MANLLINFLMVNHIAKVIVSLAFLIFFLILAHFACGQGAIPAHIEAAPPPFTHTLPSVKMAAGFFMPCSPRRVPARH